MTFGWQLAYAIKRNWSWCTGPASPSLPASPHLSQKNPPLQTQSLLRQSSQQAPSSPFHIGEPAFFNIFTSRRIPLLHCLFLHPVRAAHLIPQRSTRYSADPLSTTLDQRATLDQLFSLQSPCTALPPTTHTQINRITPDNYNNLSWLPPQWTMRTQTAIALMVSLTPSVDTRPTVLAVACPPETYVISGSQYSHIDPRGRASL